MELIDQHTKKIMEGCKERARKAGLRFQDETLEYVVTNRDLLELSPKLMIPTLYDMNKRVIMAKTRTSVMRRLLICHSVISWLLWEITTPIPVTLKENGAGKRCFR